MSNAYGKYKYAKEPAWQVLSDCQVKELPIDILRMVRSFGVKVMGDPQRKILNALESAITIFRDREWTIVYDETKSVIKNRFTIAHELGHILLGHSITFSRPGGLTFDNLKPNTEKQADIFAGDLLAPTCVLWGLGLQTPQEIAMACQISLSASTLRAEQMKILYQKDAFLTHPLEKQIFEQFRGFIAQYS